MFSIVAVIVENNFIQVVSSQEQSHLLGSLTEGSRRCCPWFSKSAKYTEEMAGKHKWIPACQKIVLAWNTQADLPLPSETTLGSGDFTVASGLLQVLGPVGHHGWYLVY